MRDAANPISLDDAAKRAAELPCWSAPVAPEPLKGGITNRNFVVRDRGQRYVVRIGSDIPEHMVVRANDIAAARAAHAAGISPEVIHAEGDAMVLRFVDGRTLTAEDVRDEAMLIRVLALVKTCHRDVPKYLRGPVLAFWVFHVIRDYFARLRNAGGRRHDELPGLVAIAEKLEPQLGRVELVFGHNDLLAANIIDDGKKLWLIDWDYAGFNSPLFDLGGLAANNQLAGAQEQWLLAQYFECAVDDDLRRRYAAMKCAALLREAMWSLVAEAYSTIDHDFAGYTDTSLAGFAKAVQDFEQDWGRL
jgi:thiamine kinase-like enzyme